MSNSFDKYYRPVFFPLKPTLRCDESKNCTNILRGLWARIDSVTSLHARSAFTFLEGASLPEWLACTAAQLQSPAMALLDRDGVYGAPRFHMAAKQCGIKTHIGAEISIAENGNLSLLVESRAGYQNLCKGK